MNILTRFSAATAVLTIGLAGSIAGTQATFAATHAARSATAPAGHLYVNLNTAPNNEVAGFTRAADGSLLPLAGSPYNAGGAGAGAIVGSQGAVQIDGKYLLAADAGSNQISVLKIAASGGLTPVAGSPFASGGDTPVSIAAHGNQVFVANSGGEIANYRGFALESNGRLKAEKGASYALPTGTVVGDVLISKDGTHLVGTRVDAGPTHPSEIDSLSVGKNGVLKAAPRSPFAAESTGPFGSAFRPTNSSQLFVSNAHAGAGNGTVSALSVASNGKLKAIGPSPYPDFQTAPCWVTISPNGQWLYAVNTAVPSISRFYISKEGTLSLFGSTSFNLPTGLRPFDAGITPKGDFLYVTDAGANAVSGFSIGVNGTLTELAGSPTALPTGGTPFGIAID